MALYRLRKQLIGKFAVFLCMRRLADNVSRVHVDDQIEMVILPGHFGMEPGGVPTPYLVRSSNAFGVSPFGREGRWHLDTRPSRQRNRGVKPRVYAATARPCAAEERSLFG